MPFLMFRYFGTPIPKARPKVSRFNTHMPKRYTDYKRDVRAQLTSWHTKTIEEADHPFPAAELLYPEDTALTLFIHFYMPLPKSTSRKRIEELTATPCMKVTGDIDNLIGGVMDALTGYVYHDDRQVTVVSARKIHVPNDEGGFVLGVKRTPSDTPTFEEIFHAIS